MTPVAQRTQVLEALDKANEVRIRHAAVKREIREGKLAVGQALIDDRAARITVYKLLAAQHGWGRYRTLTALHDAGIASETKPAGELTSRQREALAFAVALRCRPEAA